MHGLNTLMNILIYWTQGDTLADLAEHLKDLYFDLSSGHIPCARKMSDLVIP